MQSIRPCRAADLPHLLTVWINAVRATHQFLSEDEVQALLPIVRDQALPNLEVWVLHDDLLDIVGFMGLDGASLEALFIAPSFFRRGGGQQLVAHARALKGPLSVSVNEQNPQALGFYEASGFEVVGRSALDGQGQPRPLLHLKDRLAR